MQVVVEIAAFSLDPRDGRGVVVLSERATGRAFPIRLHDRDAAAVACALEGRAPPRAGGQDLVWEVVAALGAGVELVEVTGVVGGLVHARIVLRYGDELRALEARPSDAFVLALRAGAPILVEEELLDLVAARVRAAEARALPRSGRVDESPQLSVSERWNQLLAHLPQGPDGPVYEA